MITRITSIALALLLLAASAPAAEPQLVQELQQLGQAVDNMSIHISKATSDADAELMAKATQQAFAANLSGNPKPQVSVTARAGRCDVEISTPHWRLWSRAANGAIVDHGAKIN